MKQFSLDLRNFKKVSEDERSATLQHANGHEIKVAKHALSEDMKKQLSALGMQKAEQEPESQHVAAANNVASVQGLDDGGMALSDWMRQNQNQNPMQIQLGAPQAAAPAPSLDPAAMQMAQNQDALAALHNPISALFTPAGQPIANSSSGASKAMPQAAPSNFQLAPQQAAAPGIPPSLMGNSGIGQMKSGIQNEAKAIGALGQQEADISRQHQAQDMDLNAHYQKQAAQLQAERDGFMADIKAGHINPDQFIESRSGGQKIGMAIGLLLGGLGEGMTGKPNVAMQWLNKRIDQDIDAQKANLGKNQSLLAANMQQFGNLRDATIMTKAMQADIYKSKLEEAAALSKDPMAKARAQQAIGQLDAQYGAPMQALAQKRAVVDAVNSGALDVAEAVPILVPKEHQAAVFKEIQMAQNTNHMAKDILSSFEQAAKENTLLKTGGGMLRTPGSVMALHQAMQPTFQDLEGTVRQAAMDNTFKNITPMPGDSEHTVQTRREALRGYLQSKMSTPVAKGYGLDLSKISSTRSLPMSAKGTPRN